MILITGFEPFDGAESNPSFEAVKMLPEKIKGETVEKLELPVVFSEAAEKVIAAIRKNTPKAVIMTGVAGGREKITPEVVAVNIAEARIPDNKGNAPRWQPLIEGTPDGIFSTLPVGKMVQRMNEAGFGAALSFSAGTYVCNDTFYRVCNYIKENALGIPCGFIHVPNPKGMEKGTDMTVEDFAKALEICVETVVDRVQIRNLNGTE